MKKLFLTLSIVITLFLSLSSVSFAHENTQHTVTLKINKVFYDSESNSYLASTVKDASDGVWVIEIVQANHYQATTERYLNQYYHNKSVTISYIGNVQTDDDIEILNADIN